MALVSGRNEFTFIWKIHHFSMCVVENGESLDSPFIVVDVLRKTEWYLQIFPKGCSVENRLSCYLTRNEGDSCPASVKIGIGCSLTLVSVDQLSNITKTISCRTFEENDYSEFIFGNVDDIFAKRDVLLPNDILTIRCCMWGTSCSIEVPRPPTDENVIEDRKIASSDRKNSTSDQTATTNEKSLVTLVYAGNADTLQPALAESMYLSAKKNLEDSKKHLLPNKCTIRTEIYRERRSVMWKIIKFSEIQVNERIFTSIISVTSTRAFVLALYLTKDVDDNDTVQIDIQRNQEGGIRCLVKCIITILNALHEDQECVRDTYLFNCGSDVWHIPLIKKNKLVCDDQYLEDGALLLRCEFIISQEDEFSTIEETISFPDIRNTINANELVDWKNKLLETRDDKDLCDVVLQSGEQSFYAHKAILSAWSETFRALFKSDLGDFKDGKVEVTDCEPETLDKLLKYMYSGVLDNIPLEDVMKLFCAAKQYKIVALERQCSYLMRSNLDESNACKVLLLSDIFKDEVLKTAVLKFITEFSDEVFPSYEWKNLMESNAKVAGEAMHHVLTKKFVQ